MGIVFFQMRARVCDHHEEYKIGWLRGFYSVAIDNGSPHTARSKAGDYRTAESRRLYYEGYEDGRAAWNYGMREGVVVSPDRRGRYVRLLTETDKHWFDRWLRASTQKLLRFVEGLCMGRGV